MPAPRIFESVQRGTIDGYMLPPEAVQGFRLGEVTKHTTEFGFYSLAFVATMNKDRYETLSPKAKAAIDANSGMKWALAAGRGYDAGDKRALEELKGIKRHKISEDELALWQVAADTATATYLAELDGKGLPGTATYEAVVKYVAQCKAEL